MYVRYSDERIRFSGKIEDRGRSTYDTCRGGPRGEVRKKRDVKNSGKKPEKKKSGAELSGLVHGTASKREQGPYAEIKALADGKSIQHIVDVQ